MPAIATSRAWPAPKTCKQNYGVSVASAGKQIAFHIHPGIAHLRQLVA
jgi:hypothetical protein